MGDEGLLCDIASMPRFGKQSQFEEVRLGPEGETCKTKPISDGTRVRLAMFAAGGYHGGVPLDMALPN